MKHREGVSLGMMRQPTDEEHGDFVVADPEHSPPAAAFVRSRRPKFFRVHAQRDQLETRPQAGPAAKALAQVVAVVLGQGPHHVHDRARRAHERVEGFKRGSNHLAKRVRDRRRAQGVRYAADGKGARTGVLPGPDVFCFRRVWNIQ